MEEVNDHHSMIHHHLVEMGLFEDNAKDFVMTLFPLDDSVYDTFIAMSDVESENNQLPLEIPFNDVQSMRWLLHIKSFFLYLTLVSNQEQVLPSVINVITKFYQTFICDVTPEMSADDFNEIVIKMILQLSLIFEKENFMEIKAKFVLKIFTKMAQKDFGYYSKETKTTLFKILLGICDFVVNDNQALGLNTKTTETVFDLLFWVLIVSKNKENWNIFNEITSKWSFCQYFVSTWMKYFNASFGVLMTSYTELQFEMSPDDSIQTIIQLMKNAKFISETENAGILHQAFGVISDSVSQRQPHVTQMFRLRWYADEVFELFSSWQENNEHSKFVNETPVISSMTIFEKSMIRVGSLWAPALISDIQEEFKNPNSPNVSKILRQIGKLLCGHPITMKKLVHPTMECLKAKISAHPQQYRGDPLVASLLLTLEEMEINETGCTTAQEINNVLFNPNDTQEMSDTSQPTWQFQTIATMIANQIPKFVESHLYAMKITPPVEYYVYLLFAPQFMPDLMTSSSIDNFIGALLKGSFQSSILKNHSLSIALFNVLHEYAVSSDLFCPLSNERRLLTQIIASNRNIIDKDLLDFISISSFSGSQIIEPSVAHRLEEENKDYIVHLQGNNSVFSFIDNPEKNLSVIIRSTVGCFAFEISDTNLNAEEDELPKVTANSEDEVTFEIEEDFTELAELLNAVKPLNFDIPKVAPKARHMRIFSFLASTGVIGNKNEKNLLELHDIDDFINEYDSIPSKDTIEIGILHFTKHSCSMPGCRKLTPLFNNFLASLGECWHPYKSFKYPRIHEMSSMRFVFLHLDEDSKEEELLNTQMIIVFNETDYECIEEEFVKLPAQLIISVNMTETENSSDSSLIKIDLLKLRRDVAFPLIHKYPRLITTRHFSATFSLLAALEVSKRNPQTILGSVRKQRKEAIDKIYKKDVSIGKILSFPFKELM